MPDPHSPAQEETRLKVLRLLKANPNITQRQMATELGISLGGVNFCLRALVDKGWVKIDNFSRSEDKLKYAYLLTPKGMKEKTALTSRFLMRKLMEYEVLKEEIELLEHETRVSSADE